MKKSAIITVALAAGLLMTNPFGTTANAQETNQHVVKVYQNGNTGFNQDALQSYINSYLKELNSRYGFQIHINYQQPNGHVEKPTEVELPKQEPTTQEPIEKPVQKPAQEPTQGSQSAVNQFEQQVVELTNAERAKYGLSPLKLDLELSKVAREKSNDMANKGYFSHTSPTYGSPFDMMKQFGISYHAAGENIAKGQTTPEEVVNAWMNSEGHRANILSKNYTHIGVGYVSNGNIWTQMFIGK